MPPIDEDRIDAVICRLAKDATGNAARLRAKLDEVAATLEVARRAARVLPPDQVRDLERVECRLRFELVLAEGIRDGRVRRVPGACGELSWSLDPEIVADAFPELGR